MNKVQFQMKETYAFIAILFIAGNVFPKGDSQRPQSSIPKNEPVLNGSGLCFTPNKGQIADMNGKPCPDVVYKGDGGGADIYLRKTGISYVYTNMGEVQHRVEEQVEDLIKAGAISEAEEHQKKNELISTEHIKIHRVDMDFAGSNKNCRTVNENEVDGYQNFYYAHCPDGVTNVKQYNKVTYKNVYNNIDVTYYGDNALGVKYDIIVQPHADPNQIKLHWKGAESIHINREGNLVIKTSVNEFVESIPKVYQNINGEIVDVKAKYILSRLSEGEAIISFSFSAFNSSFPLVIDPWATYYGGNVIDHGIDIATDNAGNVVFTGTTASVNFPVLPGGYVQTFGGSSTPAFGGEAFVVKFNSAGTRLWATFYGGSGYDCGNGIATDFADNVVITGMTNGNFPITAGCFQTAFGGSGPYPASGDAFVVKFDLNGVRKWATYYGGSSNENGNGIATDKVGNIFITGYTLSSNFPVLSAGGYSQFFGGVKDAFVVKFNPVGTRLWATYYGGNQDDGGNHISTDNLGNVGITGDTFSSNFPVLPAGGYSQPFGGYQDAFVVKFDNVGVRQWATYYGGNSSELGNAIAMDNTGNMLITGSTASVNFPFTAAASQVAYGGGIDAFVVKFDPAGARLWATFYGGINYDWACDIAIDGDNNIYILAEIEDSDSPTLIDACSYQPVYGGATNPIGPRYGEDQLIVKFNSAGKKLCATYLGGNREDDLDEGGGMAIFGNSLYITANTVGAYPVTPGAFQTIYGGPNNYPANYTTSSSGDAFVASICTNICEGKVLGLMYTASATTVCANAPVTFTPVVVNSCDTTGYKFQWTFTGGIPSSSTEVKPTVSFTGIGTHDVKLVLTTVCKKDSVTKPAYITVNNCGLTVAAIAPGICKGNCATISAIGSNGTAPYTYSWSTGATTQNISLCPGPVVNTTYTVTIKDATGAKSTATPIVTILPVVTVTAVGHNVNCNGNNMATATAIGAGGTAPYTYFWNNSQTTAIATGLNTGNYIVTITDSKGCTNTQSVNVPAPSPVTIILSTFGSNTCPGKPNGYSGVVAVGGTPPYLYSWNTGSTASLITDITPGTYTVTITDARGCIVTTATTISTYPPVALTVVSTPNTCGSRNIINGTPIFTGTATVSPSGAPGPYVYAWSGIHTGGSTGTAGGLAAGTYTVTVADGNGCLATNTVVVAQGQIQSSPFTISPNKTVCLGTTVTFTNTGSQPTWNWSLRLSGSPYTNASSAATNFNYTFNNPGTYNISLTTTTKDGCNPITNDTVVVVNCPTGTPGVATVGGGCFATGNCSKSIVVTAAGGTSPYSYSWNTSETTSKIYPCTTSSTVYTVTVTDAAGATNIATASVLIGPAAPFTKTPLAGTICIGTKVNYSSKTISGSHSWYVDASIYGTAPDFSYTFSSVGRYIVRHSVWSIDGKCADFASDTLNVIDCSADPVVTATNNSTCVGSCAVVTSSPIGGTPPYVYAWSTGGTTQSINTCPIVTTTYTLTLTDAGGKTATTTAAVTVSSGINISVTTANANCNSGSNNSATANPGNGTAPYTFNWSSGHAVATATGLNVGATYTVTVTDSKGCSAISTIAIISHPPLTGQYTKGTANCTGCGCKEWILVNATGGASPYTYAWPDGYDKRYKNQLCPGSYIVNIKDKNGCSINVNLSAP